MKSFIYNTPTKVIFGKDSEKKIGDLILEQNCSKVLIHYGGGSVIRSGLLDRVKASLTEANVSFIELGGVKPNPRLALIEEGIKVCREEKVDFILAIGGGSVIDSAKAIGYGVANPDLENVWDLFIGKAKVKTCTPIGVILTISAAGSEMSSGCVVTKEDEQLKRSYGIEANRPKFAIMNPELTFTLPPYQVSCGIVDIIMHTMERYFSPVGNMDITDEIAEGLLRNMMKHGHIVMKDQTNYESMAEIMWMGSLSHNGLTGCGGIGDWSTHQLEHDLGGVYDVAHGAGLAAIWGSWARYVYKKDEARFEKFAKNVFNVDSPLKAIEAMEDFFKDINMPTKISECNINLSDDDIEVLADKCSNQDSRNIGSFMSLSKEDMKKIYTMAR